MVRRLIVRGWDADDAEENRRALAEIRRLGTKEDVAWHLIDGGFVEVTSSRYRQARRDAVDSLALQGVDDEFPGLHARNVCASTRAVEPTFRASGARRGVSSTRP